MPADRERNCPKCGATTTVYKDDHHVGAGKYSDFRDCDNDDCNWCVVISGGYTSNVV